MSVYPFLIIARLEMRRGLPTKPQAHHNSQSKSEETDEWDNLNLIFYRTIAEKNWSYMNENNKRTKFFMIHYTRPGEEKLKKDDQTKWFYRLNEIRKIVSHVSSDQVGQKDYNFVESVHSWLIKKESMNRFQQELELNEKTP